MASTLIQIKASGLMCSLCTMSVEKALGRLPGIRSVQINSVHVLSSLEQANEKRLLENLALIGRSL